MPGRRRGAVRLVSGSPPPWRLARPSVVAVALSLLVVQAWAVPDGPSGRQSAIDEVEVRRTLAAASQVTSVVLDEAARLGAGLPPSDMAGLGSIPLTLAPWLFPLSAWDGFEFGRDFRWTGKGHWDVVAYRDALRSVGTRRHQGESAESYSLLDERMIRHVAWTTEGSTLSGDVDVECPDVFTAHLTWRGRILDGRLLIEEILFPRLAAGVALVGGQWRLVYPRRDGGPGIMTVPEVAVPADRLARVGLVGTPAPSAPLPVGVEPIEIGFTADAMFLPSGMAAMLDVRGLLNRSSVVDEWDLEAASVTLRVARGVAWERVAAVLAACTAPGKPFGRLQFACVSEEDGREGVLSAYLPPNWAGPDAASDAVQVELEGSDAEPNRCAALSALQKAIASSPTRGILVREGAGGWLDAQSMVRFLDLAFRAGANHVVFGAPRGTLFTEGAQKDDVAGYRQLATRTKPTGHGYTIRVNGAVVEGGSAGYPARRGRAGPAGYAR